MKKSLLLTLVAVLLLSAQGYGLNLVINPGFETAESTSGGMPTNYGDWNGDYSQIVTTTSSGITPHQGSGMLQFLGTGFNENGSSTASQIVQLVDLSDFASLIVTGQAELGFSAYFNRVSGNDKTDTSVAISVHALDGTQNGFPARFSAKNYLLTSNDGLLLDADQSTWQIASGTIILPSTTTYVAVELIAAENIYPDYGTEFDGHFVDSIWLDMIPEPATIMILSAGLIFMRKKF